MGRIADLSEVLLELGLEASATEAEKALANACIRKAEGAVRKHIQYDPVRATRTEFYPRMDLNRAGRTPIWEVTDTQAYQRYLSEASSDELQLRHLPIRSITNLYVDYDGRGGAKSGAFAASTEKTEGVDFWPNYDVVDSDGNGVAHDGILRSIGRWPLVAGSVKVVYVSGYSNVELHGMAEDSDGNPSVIDGSPIHESVIDEATRRFLKVKARAKKRLAGFSGPLASESLGDYSYSANTSLLDSIVKGGDVSSETVWKLQEFVNRGIMLAG